MENKAWNMSFDGTISKEGSGVGMWIIPPKFGTELCSYKLAFEFWTELCSYKHLAPTTCMNH
jgi:hypothetical protein